MSLREIASKFNTNHHTIKRILDKNSLPLSQGDRKRRVFTQEHREKISKANKGRTRIISPETRRKIAEAQKGRKASREQIYKNMAGHLSWNISLDFLLRFENIEKIKELNHILSRDRVRTYFDDIGYMKFIEKFYCDNQFCRVFDDWVSCHKRQYARPSLDHIIPLSRGGTWNLDNLQILPWCVNRAKYNFLPEEWEYIKNKYFVSGGDGSC